MSLPEATPYPETSLVMKAEVLKMLWGNRLDYMHEVPMPDDPAEAGDVIDETIVYDHSRGMNPAKAREEIRRALASGPKYGQNVLVLGYEHSKEPYAIYL